jgi:ribonuclease I
LWEEWIAKGLCFGAHGQDVFRSADDLAETIQKIEANQMTIPSKNTVKIMETLR